MTVLLLTCGALAREVIAIRNRYGWDAEVLAVPALLHNDPSRIPEAVRKRIVDTADRYEHTIVIYGDCGTAGALDDMLDSLSVERISGPHCYEQYLGKDAFEAAMVDEPGTFFLTDFLVRSFDHLVIEGLGLDRAPELRDTYFANYRRVVYLKQTDDPSLLAKASRAAAQLELDFEVWDTGYGTLETRLVNLMKCSDKSRIGD
nr:DUF1638 domain-containing protein [Anaerolineae bacterium]